MLKPVTGKPVQALPRSLQQLSLRGLWLYLFVLLLVSTLFGYFAVSAVRTMERTRGEQLADDLALLLREQVAAYQAIVRQLTKDQQVRDILSFGDREAAQAWAVEHRRFLPHVVGLALTDQAGLLLGQPRSLRVGPACQLDLQQRAAGDPVTVLPAHFNQPGLEHYDVVETVHDDFGEPLGLLFASFNLRHIQKLLESTQGQRAGVRLQDQLGQTLATVSPPKSPHGYTHYTAVLPDIGWTLQLTLPTQDLSSVFAAIAAAALVLFVFMALLLAVMRNRIVSSLQQE